MVITSSTSPVNESGFKAFVKRHPLPAMYALMFALAWPGMILDALDSQGLITIQLPVIVSLLVGWSPGIAAVMVSAIVAGRIGARDLLRRFLVWRVGLRWYAVAFFLLAVFILGGIELHTLFGGPAPVIPAAGAPLLKVLRVFLLTVMFGLLINTEEIAWRGFALPRLQAKYSVMVACVLLAIPEAALHLPYFWNRDIAFFQTVGVFWFTAFSIALVFIYAYVFNKTNGSLIIAAIMHASQNAWANLLSDNMLPPFQFTVALAWMIAVALIFLTKGQLGYKGYMLVE